MDGGERSTEERRSIHEGSRQTSSIAGASAEGDIGGQRSRYLVEEVLGELPEWWGGETRIDRRRVERRHPGQRQGMDGEAWPFDGRSGVRIDVELKLATGRVGGNIGRRV